MERYTDFNEVKQRLEAKFEDYKPKLRKKDWELIRTVFTEKDEIANPVILKHTRDSPMYEPD